MAVINVDKIATEIMLELEVYAANTVEAVEAAVQLVARETAAELRETSPVGPTGDYAKSWAHRRNPDKGKDYMSMVVYSKKPQYGKAHLLENGHAAVDGSFVSARPHIKAAEEKAGEWLDEQLTRKLGG